MILVLITIISLLCFAIVYLMVDSYRKKVLFNGRIRALEEIIEHISKKQIEQSEKVLLSDALNENLKRSRIQLNSDIFLLNHELFNILSKHNLL